MSTSSATVRRVMIAALIAVSVACASQEVKSSENPSKSPCAEGSAVSNPKSNASLVADCDTLLFVRGALGADGLNWSTDTPIGEWQGVTTNGSYVTELHLQKTELAGVIPPSISELSKLEKLHLGGGGLLRGTIPPELGRLSELTGLWLWGNQLRGKIPSELGKLTKLEILGLDYNQLTGPIPKELSALRNLQFLALSNNELAGSIPYELGKLSNLEGLFLHNNILTGSIPGALSSLSKLRILYVSGNQGLSGCIPASLRDSISIEQSKFGALRFCER